MRAQAREHPAEKVAELRAKTVDLIKYESIIAYRDHVMSAEFQADTIQLVKDLPALAESAAKRGAEGVKVKAKLMKVEVDKYGEKMIALIPSEAELKAAAAKVKLSGAALLSELQVTCRRAPPLPPPSLCRDPTIPPGAPLHVPRPARARARRPPLS